MYRLTLDTPAMLAKPGASDHWVICESMADLSQRKFGKGEGWGGFGDVKSQKKLAQTGDLSRVSDADKYLAKLEDQSILSVARAWTDGVAGAVPNVGAYLAGSPLNMRYRRKASTEAAPIGIVFDGTTSGGISNGDMTRRGTVVLALVRLLAMRRPVELWLVAGLGHWAGDGCYVATRIETAPLDLARACYGLCHPLATRVLGYEAIGGEIPGSNGHWPYNGTALKADQFQAIAAQAFPHLTDILAIPGIVNSDPMLKNPEAWLRAQVVKYTGGEE